MPNFTIAASILAADFACLGSEVEQVLAAGAQRIHFDAMDYHYVPNLTIGPLVCQALRNYGIKAPIDIHLMVKPVDAIIPDFISAGATSIIIHPETTEHLDRCLQLIQASGCQAGLAFNPTTPLTHLKYCIDKLDNILLMAVNPGFGGQDFISMIYSKVHEAYRLIKASGQAIRLAVDGGISKDNITQVAAAGADTFIAGSAIFNKQGTCKENLLGLKQALSQAVSPD